MINKDFLLFLRAGITGVVDTSNAGVSRFKIQDSSSESDIDFAKVEELATKQNVLPLVYDGYKLYYEKYGLEAPVEVKLGWYGAAQQAEMHYKEHLKAIRTMTDYLAEKGFRTMVLKGYSLSLCYPKPSHRLCGDIDIYCFGDYKKVDELVSKSANCKVDRNHHHHTIFHWNGIMVENHYDFFNVYSNNTNRELDKTLKQMVGELKHGKNENITIPNPTFAALFSLGHVANHFVLMNVELRHLVDWYLLTKKYENEIDWNTVYEHCDRLGLREFLDVWKELVDYLFVSNFEDKHMSATAQKVLNEILDPRFKEESPDFTPSGFVCRIKRWYGTAWKRKLVYKNESSISLFIKHFLWFTNLVKPEKELEKREHLG